MSSESLSTKFEFTFKDRLIDLGLVVVLSPFWIPMALTHRIAWQYRLFRYMRGDHQEAWERCASLWSSRQSVYGAEVGPNCGMPFEHFLTEKFYRYHKKSSEFLASQLRNPDPRLAAYAFKCFIRFKPIEIEEIPSDVLARSEEIHVAFFGCCGETMTLGQYIKDYFTTSQYIQSNARSRA